jgi:hypothetical protein
MYLVYLWHIHWDLQVKNNEVPKTWYNWHKKFYYMNNVVIVNDYGLFIYLDTN